MVAVLEKEGVKLKLTVYLIKDNYKTIDDFIDGKEGYEVIEIKESGELVGTLIYKGGFVSYPPWVKIFDNTEGFDKEKLQSKSSRGMFIINYEGRYFCFTFGHSRHLIDDLSFERNFGLIVALNISNPVNINAIDKTNIGQIALHSKEQSTKSVEFNAFEFNYDVDILKSITALIENDSDEVETISGRDSASIYTRVDVKTFKVIASDLFKAFKSKKYKKLYPWIDFIKEERDKEKLKKLNESLVDCINKEELDGIWLAIPEVIVWEDVEGFSYKIASNGNSKKAGPTIYHDLDLVSWLKESKLSGKLTALNIRAKDCYLHFRDARPAAKYRIYRCLNAEINIAGEKYILNDAVWYCIDKKYVTSVNTAYKAISKSPISLPNYESNNEPDYLIEVEKTRPDFALMDRKNILIGGGRSRVEFCDLYSLDKDIIHVKQYGGSSLLSHLFQQALVSGDCFLNEPDFRVEVNKKLPEKFRLADPLKEPIAKDYKIHISIMSKVPGELEIPFFSKVSLKYAARLLTKMGYVVYLLKIDR